MTRTSRLPDRCRQMWRPGEPAFVGAAVKSGGSFYDSSLLLFLVKLVNDNDT